MASSNAVQARHRTLACLSSLLSGPVQPSFAAESAAPAVGYLASLLLRAAEREVAAGLRGSKPIRVEALQALASLIDALGRSQGEDLLAFLLPGLVSGLGKQLLSSGNPSPLASWICTAFL